MEFPAAMDPVLKWGSLHNDTHCYGDLPECRTDLSCAISWGNGEPQPSPGYGFGKVKFKKDQGNQQNYAYYKDPPNAQSGMESGGDYGFYLPRNPHYNNEIIEYCRVCAHTKCEKSSIERKSEESFRCKAGYAQAIFPEPRMKPSSTYPICDKTCPAGTWMTCSGGDSTTCVYPPWLQGERYAAWRVRVAMLGPSVGIQIPYDKTDALTLLPQFTSPPTPTGDLSQCFPCHLAANYNHYGSPVGELHEDADGAGGRYADYYCLGGTTAPTSCIHNRETGLAVKAGGDMGLGVGGKFQGAGTCQCLAGYYSHAHETVNGIITGTSYQNLNSGALDCRVCPPGKWCRFRADTVDTVHNTLALKCIVGQQMCPCPINSYCSGGAALPIKCDVGACPQESPARTWCNGIDDQKRDSTCTQCWKCKQMRGGGPPCLNMVDLSNMANSVNTSTMA